MKIAHWFSPVAGDLIHVAFLYPPAHLYRGSPHQPHLGLPALELWWGDLSLLSEAPEIVMFQVQSRQCTTCIYRKASPHDITKLEAQIADPKMKGYFIKYRECHHAARGSGVCCRGFWNAHANDFTAGQLAQRLNLVEFVEVDVLRDS